MQSEIEVFFSVGLTLSQYCGFFRARRLAKRCAPVAQLDRAPDYESGGQGFESLRVYHFFKRFIFQRPFFLNSLAVIS